MFNIKLNFATDTLPKWFNMKTKSKNLVVDPEIKTMYKINNPMNQEKDKCTICNFPLHIILKGSECEDSKMLYTDFLIRKENKFFRNIYSQEDLSKSYNLKNVKSYYFAF